MPPPTRQPGPWTQRVDLGDDDLLAQLCAVEAASQAHQRPWADAESVRTFTLDHRHQDSGEHRELWVAMDADRAVGVAKLWIPLDDNTDKAFVDVQVHPEHRNRGIGTALVADMIRVSRGHGRAEVLSDLLMPLGAGQDHPYLRFARHRGFAVASTDSMRHLSLPLTDDHLRALEEETLPAWSGAYRLQTYVDGVPDELQESLCDTENQLAADAPGGSVDYEPESLTPSRYRANLELFRAQGRYRCTTVALDADERVVAYTDLVVGAGTRRTVWQWGTLVRREHRGHRLGLAVKVQNLRRIQTERPERTLVVTGNDDLNSPMLAINDALGFRVVERCPQLQLVL